MSNKGWPPVWTTFTPSAELLPHLPQPATSINLFWPQDEVRLAVAEHMPRPEAF